MKKNILLIILFITGYSVLGQKVHLSGYIRDAQTKEALIGVNIKEQKSNTHSQSNQYGFFNLPVFYQDSIVISLSLVGYNPLQLELQIKKDSLLDIVLEENTTNLEEVKIKAEYQKESHSSQMSSMVLTTAQIKQMPLIFGEKDPLKALQILPGVSTGTEGSAGFYVRGGGTEQNLLLLDEAIVYNANHLFGFFSTFNADPIKRVELFKGAFPAKYGGRLSSVVDVQMKEGNKKKIQGEGGIGLISSRFTLDGPLKKNKSSYLFSIRRTYADALTKPFFSKNSSIGYYFYDFNTKINSEINENNTLYLSYYQGNDKLNTNDIRGNVSNYTAIQWGNRTGVLRWNNIINKNIFSNYSAIYTLYHFGIKDDLEQKSKTETNIENLRFDSSIQDVSLKADYDYYFSPNVSLRWGGVYTFHRFNPRKIRLFFFPNIENNVSNEAATIKTQEGGIYGEATIHYHKNLTLHIGGRESVFTGLEKIQINFEPRLAAHYLLHRVQSIQISYARMNQYTHLVSNTGNGLPTDLWVPATQKIKPAQSDQIAFAYTKDNIFKNISMTCEIYYKWLRNIIAYKDGASFLELNTLKSNQKINWENDLTSGKSWTYGYEFLLQKKQGKITGLMGYTLSWAIQQFGDLNEGRPFYASQDRRHNFEFSSSYAINKSIRLSTNFLFMTGNPLTVPSAVYFNQDGGGDYINYYLARNAFRAEPYHRLDVGIQFLKKKKWGERAWDISIYNLYNRKNPFYYSTTKSQLDGYFSVGLTRNWLLPILPSVTYNFKF